MDELLAPLASGIAGFVGAAILDENNRCVSHQLQPPLEPILFEEIVLDFREASAMLQTLDGSNAREIVMRCQEGLVLGRETSNWWLMLIARPTKSTAMFRVAMTAAMLKLENLIAEGIMNSVSSSIAGEDVDVDGMLQEEVADAVPIAVMRGLVTEFTRFAGPFAKVVVKRELRAMGLTSRSVGKEQFDYLVRILGDRIEGPADRREFFIAVARLGVRSSR